MHAVGVYVVPCNSKKNILIYVIVFNLLLLSLCNANGQSHDYGILGDFFFLDYFFFLYFIKSNKSMPRIVFFLRRQCLGLF
jgi:hypothetical protein